jgi:hypothetical protein
MHEIIKENNLRKQALAPNYDPITGYGDSVGPRQQLSFIYRGTEIEWNIPLAMANEPIVGILEKQQSIEKEAKKLACPHEELFYLLTKIRCRYDHEFWAATCAKIQDKETAKIIPFILNKPQRKLQAEIERQRRLGKPVRIILCKARQWGGSTNVQLDMFRTQLFREQWNSVIVTDVESQALFIRNMTKKVALYHPNEILPVHIKNFERSSKNRYIEETGSILSIGSMQKPDSLRSQDIKMAHLSEVGLWKKTEGKTPEDLIQTISGSILPMAGTMIVKESTAKGVGNYFHNAWLEAVNGRSDETPIFVAWYEIALYQMPVEGSLKEFWDSMNDYEHFLWHSGATLEGINWYREKFRSFKGDQWRMQSEFPTTPDEAFNSSARRVFSPVYVKRAEAYVKPPMAIGEVAGEASKGTGALKKIQFAHQLGGCLKVWRFPDPAPEEGIAPGAAHRFRDRYCAFLDIGGRTDKADYSVLTVIDRLPMIKGEPAELAARWRGHIDQDLLAWKAATICRWFDSALLGVEVNSLHSRDEADHSHTILDEIAEHYPNLYYRTTVEDIMNNIPRKYGFHTNRASKEMIIDCLNAALRESDYIERDAEAIVEFNCFEEKTDGTKGAIDGAHDDIVISTAGAVWLATSYMEPPKIIDKAQTQRYYREIVNESTF